MNRRSFSDELDLAVVDVGSEPVPLQLPAGAAVFALRGALWLTQEGRRDDVMLRPGRRYDAAGRGTILVSSLPGSGQGPAAIIWFAPREARALPAADLQTLLRARAARIAHAERERALDAMVAAIAARIRKALPWLRRRRSDPAATPPRPVLPVGHARGLRAE